MIWYNDIEQGSEAWLRLRAGIPTASEFHKILTPTGKLSTQAEGYMHHLLAEVMVGHPFTSGETSWMLRGGELEPEAALAYELETGTETKQCGFVTNDEGTIGASPDRLIGENGLLEIKCPSPATHIGYLLTRQVEKEKLPQLQGQLYITGRQWVDVLSYHPELPRVIVRVERDEDYQQKLHEALAEFVSRFQSLKAQLTSELALP